jgi:hypothetical protein
VSHLQPIAVTREDVGPLLAVVAIALVFHVLPTVLLSQATGLPVRALSVYFDGQLIAICVVVAGYSFWAATRDIPEAVAFQTSHQPFLADMIARLGSDEPSWVDFRALYHKATDGLEAAPGAH